MLGMFQKNLSPIATNFFAFFLGLTYNTWGKGWLSILFSLCLSVVFILILCQARRQDIVTGGGGAEINLGGAREVYLYEFERGTGAQFILVWIKRTLR